MDHRHLEKIDVHIMGWGGVVVAGSLFWGDPCVVLGALLANSLGERLAGAVIASFGASSFTFVVNPLMAYLLSPLLMGTAVLMATVFGTLDAGKIQIVENIRE